MLKQTLPLAKMGEDGDGKMPLWKDQSQLISRNSFFHLFFSFRGRSKRIHYWGAVTLIWLTAWTFGKLFYPYKPAPLFSGEWVISGIGLILTFLLQWSLLVVTIKRWHDRNRSGWWTLAGLLPLLILLPIYGQTTEGQLWVMLLVAVPLWVWIIVELGFLPGTDGPNRYGDHKVPFT